MPSAVVSLPPIGSRNLVDSTSGSFKDYLNNDSFQFSHALAYHPLFELPRLAELSKTVIASSAGDSNHYVLCKRAESIPNSANQWENYQPLDRVHESIKHIQESGTWVLITGAQVDPDYQELLDKLLLELEDLCGAPLRSEISWACVTILIGSPNSVTHYHMDSETNFLFQIHGNKEAHLFDQKDRTILSETDIEKFFTIGGGHIKFREEFQAKAKTFNLAPGSGIHIPINAPHWVRNLSDYSVTLSILFYLRNTDRRAWAYQANHLIRKLGLTPKPPGESPQVDRIKSGILEMLTTRSPRDKYDILRSGYRRLTLKSGYRLLTKPMGIR